jgi:hypothetical protein
MIGQPTPIDRLLSNRIIFKNTLFSYLSAKDGDCNAPFDVVELYQQGKLPVDFVSVF